MTTKEAAEVIGCSPQQVRTLIRTGKLRATKNPSKNNQFGYEYAITKRTAERHRDNGPTRGWPRGTPRK